MSRRPPGYILVETVTALAVMSIVMAAMNVALRQALYTRALARDYTQARFLLDQVVGAVELEPVLQSGSNSGVMRYGNREYEWSYEISTVSVPQPPMPAGAGDEVSEEDFELPVTAIPKIRATVSWVRRQQAYSAVVETLADPDKLLDRQQQLLERRIQLDRQRNVP